MLSSIITSPRVTLFIIARHCYAHIDSLAPAYFGQMFSPSATRLFFWSCSHRSQILWTYLLHIPWLILTVLLLQVISSPWDRLSMVGRHIHFYLPCSF